MKRIVLAVASSILLVRHATAEEPGEVAKGAELARSVCAQCHAVASGDLRSPDPMAPSFTSLARTPGMTGTALRVWLQTSHPTMPNYVFAGNDRDDIVAYILSLNPPRPST